MAWCRQATSHYLSQCWPRSMSPYGITRPQWVNSCTTLIFQAGNDFGDEFDELQYVMKSVMLVKLKVEEPQIVFDPAFRECRDIILRCFSEICASGEGLPRVECELFPDMRGQRLLLRSVKLEESLVTDYMDRAMEIFKLNTLGPQKYRNTYKKYADLLNNKAEQEVTAFLKERHSLHGFKKVRREGVIRTNGTDELLFHGKIKGTFLSVVKQVLNQQCFKFKFPLNCSENFPLYY